MTAMFSVEVPRKRMLSLNGRRHWREADEVRREIAALVAYSGARRLERWDRATLWVGVEKPDRRLYDAQNLQATVKVIVDALVRMKVLPDDDNEHVVGPFLYHAGVDAGLRGRLGVERVRFVVQLEPYGVPAHLYRGRSLGG